MNDIDETTFARFAERFARIERQVPEPPLRVVHPMLASPRIRRLSPIAALVGVAILLAGVVGLAGIGPQPSPSPTAVTIPPTPTAAQPSTLQGRILDAEGKPVPDATVTAYPRAERGPVAGSTVTDADGRWAITLPSGNRYCLELDLSIAGPAGTTATEWQAYYGPAGIGQPTDAWPCLDQVGNIVLDATLPAMHLVSGTIVDKAGRPITLIEAGGPFTKFELSVSSPSMGATSRPGADGRFSIWVPEGSWSVIAWVFRDEQPFLSPATTLEVRTDPISDFTLRVDTSSLNVE